ncbi:MAG TPA: C40 family peptidase [Pedococcus sp.]|nr:C40 family peptidase [Pedococcus sp.]
MPRTHATRRARRGVATLAIVGIFASVPALAASADPGPVFPSQQQVDKAKAAVVGAAGQIAALDAQYAAASARLVQVQDKAAAAGEAYNGAKFRLDQATAATASAQQRAAAAQTVADAALLVVRRYAATVYQQGGNFGEFEAFLSASGPQDMMDRATSLQAVGDARARTLENAAATSIVAEQLKRQAAQAQAQQQAAAEQARRAHEAAQAEANRAQAATTQIQAEQQAMVIKLAKLRKTSVTLEKQRQAGLAAAAAARAAAAEAARQARLAAARAAAAQAAARAAAEQAAARAAAQAASQQAAAAAAQAAANAIARQSQPSPPPVYTPPPPPPSNGGVSAVLAYAYAQLGKPYVWGASGPDAFDCSGLTEMAWAQAGVNLYHYTGAQWDQTSRVALSDLQPGDLVFFGSDGPSSEHVGIYIGNGQMIDAPHSGASVRIESMYWDNLLPYGGRP